jgi:hypothetical protein
MDTYRQIPSDIVCEKALIRPNELFIYDLIDYPNHKYSFVYNGLKCTIRRSSTFLMWNGYVRVPKDHPYYRKNYDSKSLEVIDVHGGLTYSNGHGTFGFDTGHEGIGDYTPGLPYWMRIDNYARTYDETIEEIKYLADQLLQHHYPKTKN